MIDQSHKWKWNERGLTLIEVLIVVFIISIILAILIPNYSKSTERAQTKLCFSNQKIVEAQIELYHIDYNQIIATESDLQKLVDAGYLRKLPECPETNEKYTFQNGKIFCPKHKYYADVNP